MNNNQDNFNNNPQPINMNDQNRFLGNINQQSNIISQTMNNEANLNEGINPMSSDINKDNSQITSNNNFINPADGNLAQFINNNNQNSKFVNTSINDNFEEINPLANQKQNKFITENKEVSSTGIHDLNIDGEYHDMPKVDYSLDPKVQENLNKKNTVTITSEGKVFIIIIIVLLLFIFVMPYIFDFIRDITY